MVNRLNRVPCHPVATLCNRVKQSEIDSDFRSATLCGPLRDRHTGIANEGLHKQGDRVELAKIREHRERDLATLLALGDDTKLVRRDHGYHRTIHAIVDGVVLCKGRIRLEQRETAIDEVRQLVEQGDRVSFCGRCVRAAHVAQLPPEPEIPEDPRDISVAKRARVMERDGFRCRRCGWSVDDGVKLVIDHIVPVCKGGTGAEPNLQTLCADCNAGKGARDPHPHDFIQ